MNFLDTIPLNATFYGCETVIGNTVWSQDWLEILRCPERKRFTPIYESKFSDIRDRFNEVHNENPSEY